MSAASDRLAAITASSFANGAHRTAFPQVCNDTATVAGEIAADKAAAAASEDAAAASAALTAADRVQTGADRVAASASAQAAAATIPILGDRTVGRRPSDTAIWPMLRATPAWGFGVNGALEESAVDTLRWEFDPTTRAPLGAAFAGARTNLVQNPRFDGATLGVIGSGGVLPSSVNSVLPAGMSQEVVAVGTINGRPYIDWRVFGTAASADFVRFQSRTASITWAASEPVAWTGGYALVAGSLTGFTTYAMRLPLASVASGGQVTVPAPTSTIQAGSSVAAMNAGTSLAAVEWLFGYGAGVAIDATFRFVMPQIQRGRFMSAPILPAIGTPAASTRAQGSVTQPVQQFGTRWNYRQGLILVDWNSQPGPFTSADDADWFGLISWGDTTADNRLGILVNPAHTSVEARVTAGGAVQTASARAITAAAAGVTTRAAVAWDLDAGFLQVAARGSAGSKVALTALPVPGFIMPGRFGTSHPLFGRLQGYDLRPAALFDSALAALT